MVVMIIKVFCTFDKILSCYHVTCTLKHNKKTWHTDHFPCFMYLLLLNFAMTHTYSSYFCIFHFFFIESLFIFVITVAQRASI